jgi:hypothetical protein
LNFDPLLFRAFEGFRDSSDDQNQTPKFNLIALHEPKDISRYFGSPENSFQPAASSARGDIFYVRCQNKNCPSFDLVRPLTTDKQTCDPKDKIHPFKCVACHLETLKLELSFPSYHTKEQLIQPLLSQLQEYLATQTSAIIIIGLSGKWDPYLLAGLFHWADIHSTPIIDVKPKPEDLLDESDMFIDKFRYLYFPGVPNSSTSQDLSGYYRYISKGDPFMMRLYSVIENCGIKLPKLQSLTRTTEVTNVK